MIDGTDPHWLKDEPAPSKADEVQSATAAARAAGHNKFCLKCMAGFTSSGVPSYMEGECPTCFVRKHGKSMRKAALATFIHIDETEAISTYEVKHWIDSTFPE